MPNNQIGHLSLGTTDIPYWYAIIEHFVCSSTVCDTLSRPVSRISTIGGSHCHRRGFMYDF